MKVQNRRVISLLKIFHEKTNLITSHYLAQVLGVSTRTVRSDIKELSNLLKKSGACIESKPSQGYRMRIDNVKEYESLRRKLMGGYIGANIVPQEKNDRLSFIIAHILLNSLHKKVVLQEALADELFISLSTLKKYLGEIKNSLARFGLSLETDRSHGVRIVGDEAKIRYCISEYMFNRNDLVDLSKNPFFETIFSKEEIEFLKEILLKVVLKHNIHLTDVAFKNLLIHIIITLSRQDAENTVEYKKEEQKNLERSFYFGVVEELLEYIKNGLGINLKNECYYLTQHFIASRKYIASDQVVQDCRPLVDEILRKIKRDIGVDLSEDEELISGLTIHLLAAINRLKFNMNIHNRILSDVKKNYPLAFEMAILAGEVIEKEEHVHSNENEIGFLAIHFGASLERNHYNKESGKTAIILCGAGLSTAMLLKAKLQRAFGSTLQIKEVMTSHKLTQEMLDGVDFVFSTVPVNGFMSDKIIYVDPILTKKDLEFIHYRMQRDSSSSINYEQLIKRELFFERLSADNVTDVLETMTSCMLEKGYIDKKTKESIFERERLSPTGLEGMVAVPHAMENYMEDAAICTAVLNNPINWNNVSVQIVFLLSIPKAYYKMLEPVIWKIYTKFVEQDGFRRMERKRSFEELMEILREP